MDLYLIRHMLATLAFRTQHALRGAPDNYPDFKAGNDTLTPTQIINHMADIAVASGEYYRGHKYELPEPVPYRQAIERFHTGLANLDHTLAESKQPDDALILQFYQGPWLDMMTHVGQLMLLRRLAGPPVKTEPYSKSDIKVGHLGPDQPLETA